jgi:hypothetical protein
MVTGRNLLKYYFVVKLGRDKLKNRTVKIDKIYIKIMVKNDAKMGRYKC